MFSRAKGWLKNYVFPYMVFGNTVCVSLTRIIHVLKWTAEIVCILSCLHLETNAIFWDLSPVPALGLPRLPANMFISLAK